MALVIRKNILTAPAAPATTWPKASDTGTTGTLTTYTGPHTLTVAGTTIENKIINGNIYTEADNITIRNCKMQGFNIWALYQNSGNNLLIEYCDVDGIGATRTSGIGIRSGGTGHIVRYCEVHRMTIGMQIGGGCQIYGNYIHDLQEPSPDPADRHFDGITFFSGFDSVIENNAIVDITSGTACIFVANRFGNIGNILIKNNLMMGNPAYTLYFEDYGGWTITGTTVQDNYIEWGIYGSTYFQTAATPSQSNNTTWNSAPQGTDPIPAAVQTWLAAT
jgi:hypothetical protein